MTRVAHSATSRDLPTPGSAVISTTDAPAPRRVADLRDRHIEHGHDLKTLPPETRVVGQRQTQVTRAHHRDPELAVKAEDLPKVLLEILDVVAHTAHAKFAEVREVLANLRGIQLEPLGQGLRRDRLDAGRLQLVQAAKIDG